MKNYEKFIKEEISLRGNQGIPDNLMRDTDAKAQRELGVRKDEPRQMQTYGPQIMGLVEKSQQLTYGGLNRTRLEERMVKLEDLAKEVILSEYSTILENVDLDIKLVRPGKVSDDIPEMGEMEQKPQLTKLDDPEIRKEVDKAKIANNIIQGEAKNTKTILHSDIAKEGLQEIFGNGWKEIFDVWDETIKIANKMDWIIPIDDKADMMVRMPQGLAGAVKVEWPEKEEETDPEAEKKALADKILKSLEKGDDLEDNQEDISELMSTGNPKIIARGIDFPMLLHESVKGIYELIAAAGIPDDEETAEIVKMNTSSFEDEAEDFRYGPYIAAALRDFVNKCDGSDKHPNMREHVFGKMMRMPASEFLLLMKGILENKPEAKKQITDIIIEVDEEIREYEIGNIESEYDDSDDSDVLTPPEGPEETEEGEEDSPKEVDYSKMRQSELQKLMDDALDISDFDTVKKIIPFIKESVTWKAYASDIKKILNK